MKIYEPSSALSPQSLSRYTRPMLYPDLETAEKEIEIAGTMNPGPWTAHSRNVGLDCALIAERIEGLDPEKARILGLMHDIGRRVGRVQERHMVAGYQFCMERGWSEQAKICISHAFMIKDAQATLGKWDVSQEEYEFVVRWLGEIEYDDYDRLVQLCDSLAIHSGFCLLEKRFVDVSLRYGVNEHVVPRWKAIFDLKDYFEKRGDFSIYDILPGIKENTFHGSAS
jgi:hypothetical protein